MDFILAEFIVRYWVELLFSGSVSVLMACVKGLHLQYKSLKLGVQAMLRDRIITSYYHYKARNSITLHGLENINRMYEQYKNLGGNGTVTILVDFLRTLEVVDD